MRAPTKVGRAALHEKRHPRACIGIGPLVAMGDGFQLDERGLYGLSISILFYIGCPM